MSYIALYRKYRPHNFANVVGQETTVDILINSIKDEHISHAYLFCGPRGTGKTSIAKIFAKAINCLHFENDICESCDICKSLAENDIDIVEIDAASNNGVDEIRVLRDNVKLMPSICKYKVYIIDEVHMLSTGAFNALLKTLEEPPAHVVFILATTEPNKIPLTILSRCQRFDFNRVPNEKIIKRLKFILESENQTLNDRALEQIAICSDGCLRDAVNMLDQVISFNNPDITEDEINKLSGRISIDIIIKIITCIIEKKYTELLNISSKLNDEGKNLTDVVSMMINVFRDALINYEVKDYFDESYTNKLKTINIDFTKILNITNILNELIKELKNSNDQKSIFEIYLLQISNMLNDIKMDVKLETDNLNSNQSINTIAKSKVSEEKTVLAESNAVEKKVVSNDFKRIRINNVLAQASKEELNKVLNDYDMIDDYISNKKYNNIVNLLEDGKVVVASNKYLLFSFNNENQVNLFDEQYDKIEIFLKDIYNKEYKIVSVTDEEWIQIKKDYINNKKNNISYTLIEEDDVKLNERDESNNLEDSATNIFGKNAVSIK